MTSETQKLKRNLATLTNSLDELESQIGRLFEQTLPETVAGLETLQQAKLQSVIPYLVYDLIFSSCFRVMTMNEAEMSYSLLEI